APVIIRTALATAPVLVDRLVLVPEIFPPARKVAFPPPVVTVDGKVILPEAETNNVGPFSAPAERLTLPFAATLTSPPLAPERTTLTLAVMSPAPIAPGETVPLTLPSASTSTG